MLRSVEATAEGLGDRPGRAWKRIFAAPARGFDALAEDVYRPLPHLPRHPLLLARFGAAATLPATALVRALPGEEAKALFGGVAAHAIAPLERPISAAIGMALICSGQRYGWPVAVGGSGAIVTSTPCR